LSGLYQERWLALKYGGPSPWAERRFLIVGQNPHDYRHAKNLKCDWQLQFRSNP